MPVDLTVAATLLSWAAALDNRSVTDEAVHAWAASLNPNVTPVDGKEAISEHFRTSTDYLMPQHVNYGAARIRERRIGQTEANEIPPASLDDDGRGSNAWKIAFRKAIGSGVEHGQAYAYACQQVGVPMEVERATVREITAGQGMPDEVRVMIRNLPRKRARTA